MNIQNTSGLTIQMLPASVLENGTFQGSHSGNMGDRIVSKQPNKFATFVNKVYQDIVNNETIQSLVSFFGHMAIGLGEGVAAEKAKQLIAKKTKSENSPYSKVAEVVIQESAKVTKEFLPKKSLPPELYKSLSSALRDFQLEALIQESKQV
ncbi:MAG: hypothetical protein VX777_03160 [Chlamydiota bacterium]|nr:hypothetical protein [Chlamydiota bacterium]